MMACGSNQLSLISRQKNFFSLKRFCYIVTALFLGCPYDSLADQQTDSNNGWRGQPSFFERRSEGWHWYQDSVQKPEIREQKSLRGNKTLSPTEQIEKQRKNIEQKLHTAIVEPTRENLISYITAQKALMDQSQHFAEMWKQVVMTTPSLDETLQHPVDQNACHLYYAAQHQHIEKQIKKLASEYGLFFFFRKNCAYCHHFSHIVKRFSQKYGWSVLGISLDGGTLPEFPHAKQNNGIAERLNISHVPALIALHPKTAQLIPLAYGLVSESEIEQRVELLTRIPEGAQK
jgi:conjugal transfer pilus assembly protein TraF